MCCYINISWTNNSFSTIFRTLGSATTLEKGDIMAIICYHTNNSHNICCDRYLLPYRTTCQSVFGISQISISQQSFEIPEAFRVSLELLKLKHKSLELTEKLKEMTSGDILENLKKYREEKEKIEYYLKKIF